MSPAPTAEAAAGAPFVVVAFHRLGPYHHARLQAARERLGALGTLEFSSVDDTYAWDRVPAGDRAGQRTLFTDQDSDRKGARAILARVEHALAGLAPDVVGIPGWDDRCALACLRWCQRRRVPAVLMSESVAADRPRRWWREWVKRRVVRLYAAALVGGGTHARYAAQLGMPPAAIVTGYDAVDNDHFARGAARARRNPASARARRGLPARFFLACARFVEPKNLVRLLEAYALYRAGAIAPWRLVILGDGLLRARLVSRIARLGLADDVLLPGFQQYGELPAYYGLAGAFVHASTTEPWGLVVNEAMASGLPVLVSERCGCAPDLVRPGVNGFTFDPLDVGRLAALMAAVGSDRCDCAAMGRASREIIAAWRPERFAAGLIEAAAGALGRPLPRASWLDRCLLWALVHR